MKREGLAGKGIPTVGIAPAFLQEGIHMKNHPCILPGRRFREGRSLPAHMEVPMTTAALVSADELFRRTPGGGGGKNRRLARRRHPPGRRGRSGISNGNPVPLAQERPRPDHQRRTRRRRGCARLDSSGPGYLSLRSGLSVAALSGAGMLTFPHASPRQFPRSRQPSCRVFISASSLRRYSSLPSSSSRAHSSSDRKEGVPACRARHWISACSSMARLR